MSQSLYKRAWLDWNVLSHLAFLPAVIFALGRDPAFYELIVLMITVVSFSVTYHRLGEQCNTLIAKLDKYAAHVLFMYGLIQIHYSSYLFIKFICAIFAVVVATTHAIGQIYPHLWQSTHAMGMHVVPGVWCCFVACFNDSIFF